MHLPTGTDKREKSGWKSGNPEKQKSSLNKLRHPRPPAMVQQRQTRVHTFILIWYRWIICINDIVLAKKITLFFPRFLSPFASSKRQDIHKQKMKEVSDSGRTGEKTALSDYFQCRPHSYSFIWVLVRLIRDFFFFSASLECECDKKDRFARHMTYI